MSRYYTTVAKYEGGSIIYDGFVVEFANDLPTEEEIKKFYDDALKGEFGVITFMQKLYTGGSSFPLFDAMGGMMKND